MADDPNKIEIEIAVRDSMSAALRTMGRELEALNRKALETGISGAGGLEKFSRQTGQLSEITQRTSRSLSGMGDLMSGMAKTLLGPVGLAAGFVAVAKSMDNFAVSQLQLHNFATNTGFATSKIIEMNRQLARSGIDAGQARSEIASVGAKLQEIATYGVGSRFAQEIAYGDAALARSLVTLKTHEEQIRAISDSYNRGTQAWKNYIVEKTGASHAFWEAQNDDLRGATKEFEYSKAELKKYHQEMDNLYTAGRNVFNEFSMTGIRAVAALGEEFHKLGYESHGLADDWQKLVDQFNRLRGLGKTPILPGLFGETPEERAKTTAAERYMTEDYDAAGAGRLTPSEQRDRTRGKLQEEADRLRSTQPFSWQKLFRRQSLEGDLELPHGASPIMFSRTAEDLTKIEEDSNRILSEIRDTLQGRTGFGGGGGGSSASPYGGTNAPGGVGGSVGMGGVSSKLQEGVRAGAELGLPEGYTYKFISGFRAGDPGYHGRGQAADIQIYDQKGNPIPNVGNHPQRYLYDNVAKATQAWFARHYPGYNYTYGGHFNTGVRDDLMHHQEGGVSARHFSNEEIQAEIERQNKVDVEGRQRRQVERTGQQISGIGRGSTFNDAQTASGLPSNIPGIALPSRAGLGKQFKITTPDGRSFMALQTDVGPAAWTGRGIDINQPLALQMGYGRNFPTDAIFQWEQAREELDRSLKGGGGAGPNGTLSAEVDFKNVPPGVRTSAEGVGFRNLRITSTKQGQKDLEGMLAPGAMAYTPWVP